MKRKYSIAVTLPLTLWVEVETTDDQQALEKAKKNRIKDSIQGLG